MKGVGFGRRPFLFGNENGLGFVSSNIWKQQARMDRDNFFTMLNSWLKSISNVGQSNLRDPKRVRHQR